MTGHAPLPAVDAAPDVAAGGPGRPARDGIDRRRLLLAAASTALAGPVSAAPAGFIDAHSHAWSGNTARYPLVAGGAAAERDPPSYDIEALLGREAAVGVGRVVLVQHIGYDGFDCRYLTDAARAHPGTFAVVAAVDDRRDDAPAAVLAAKAAGAKGFRIRGVDTAAWPGSRAMNAMWETAAAADLVICPLLRDGPDMSDDALLDVATLARRHAETSVCLDHMAHVMPDDPRQLDRLCALAAFPRVTVKVSGLDKFDAPPYPRVVPQLLALLAAFGPQRLMWGSDMPVLERQPPNTLADALAFVSSVAPLGEADRHWLLRGTAERVFFS